MSTLEYATQYSWPAITIMIVNILWIIITILLPHDPHYFNCLLVSSVDFCIISPVT